jgi:hypothetical protein
MTLAHKQAALERQQRKLLMNGAIAWWSIITTDLRNKEIHMGRSLRD